ncbi:hypothetical protein C8R47DRAFT_1228454 [Mycena vitilis]|nr:hypothetical protein C8R47DRAFT_1228454 [Mycena vitilis]
MVGSNTNIATPGAVPPETLCLIFAFLVGEYDDHSVGAIAEAAHNLPALLEVSATFRNVSINYQRAWVNLRFDEFPWGRGRCALTMEQLKRRLIRSGDQRLRIIFNLRVSGAGDSTRYADRVWSELVQNRHRWGDIHLQGPRRCDDSILCLWGMVAAAGLTHSTPNIHCLRAEFFRHDPSLPCEITHGDPFRLCGTNLARLQTNYPMGRPEMAATATNLEKLTFLDLADQHAKTWTQILRRAPNIETLIWGHNEFPGRARVLPIIATLPKLTQLTLMSAKVPPIHAPNLEELVVSDASYALDDLSFQHLTGTHRLRRLDVMQHAIISTASLASITEQCLHLVRVRMNTDCKDGRRDVIRLLSQRVVVEYFHNVEDRLLQIDVSSIPKSPALERDYEFLERLGALRKHSFHFHPKLFRVRCFGCRGTFSDRDLAFLQQFKADNRYDSSLILVTMYEALKSPAKVTNPFSIILFFSNARGMEDCMSRPVKFREGWCTKVEEFKEKSDRVSIPDHSRRPRSSRKWQYVSELSSSDW